MQKSQNTFLDIEHETMEDLVTRKNVQEGWIWTHHKPLLHVQYTQIYIIFNIKLYIHCESNQYLDFRTG